jgi:hypothetical protein
MGSVPRINCHLAVVPLPHFFLHEFLPQAKFFMIIKVTSHVSGEGRTSTVPSYMIDSSKGVSILSNRLPYTLKLVRSYAITSNSKAA